MSIAPRFQSTSRRSASTLRPSTRRRPSSRRIGPARFRIEGHADYTYDWEYNERLSAERAEAVKEAILETLERDFKVKRGDEGVNIMTLGLGERLPTRETSRYEDLAVHRRVEIFCFGSKEVDRERNRLNWVLATLDEKVHEVAVREAAGESDGELNRDAYAIRFGYWLIEYYDALKKCGADAFRYLAGGAPDIFFYIPRYHVGAGPKPWTWGEIRHAADFFYERLRVMPDPNPFGADERWPEMDARIRFILPAAHWRPGEPDAGLGLEGPPLHAAALLGSRWGDYPRGRDDVSKALEPLKGVMSRHLLESSRLGDFYFRRRRRWTVRDGRVEADYEEDL